MCLTNKIFHILLDVIYTHLPIHRVLYIVNGMGDEIKRERLSWRSRIYYTSVPFSLPLSLSLIFIEYDVARQPVPLCVLCTRCTNFQIYTQIRITTLCDRNNCMSLRIAIGRGTF